MAEQSELAQVASELKDIKRLIMVALTRGGMTQQQLADALGVAQSKVSTMLSNGKSKKKGTREAKVDA